MNLQGFLDFNARLSPENSGKAGSYVRAITILDNVLVHQREIDLHGKSLYAITDISTIEDILLMVKAEVKKMKRHEPNIFDYGDPRQKSYPLKGFCSAALRSLIKYAEYNQEILDADKIVSQERNPQIISNKLITHFDLTREGEDAISLTKQRKGQDYFRRMILSNYSHRCAITGIDIPQLLLASHIIPWSDTSHKEDRLNPENGILLSALYDKAFDKGLITVSPDDYTIRLSSALQEYETQIYYYKYFGSIKGKRITLPTEYKPNKDFLAYHRDHVFLGN